MTQRLRLTYSAVGPLRYVAHLDVMRTWERAIRRAGLPLAYTQGFSPHARLALAAPLPVGVVGHRELVDLWLSETIDPPEVVDRLNGAMPPGMTVLSAEEVGERVPSLQSSLRSASYEVRLPPDTDLERLRERIRALLERSELPWEEQRGERLRRYDLRETIIDLRVREADGPVLELDLSLEEGRTGRPAQVLLALEIDPEPLEVARTEVRIDQAQLAVQAWRERGRFQE